MANDAAHDHAAPAGDPAVLNVPAVAADRQQSTRLATSILQSVSDIIAGRSPQRSATAADFTDEPQAPWELSPDPELSADPAAENDAAGKAAAAPPPPRTSGAHAWGGHANGKIPPESMKAVGQGKHRLEAVAADAFATMRAAAAADGVTLKLTDSYRSYDEQVAVRKKKGHVVATATPGTSVHGWGKAIDADVNDPKTLAWLRANAHKYGWVNPPWAQQSGKSYEPWHWQHEGRPLPKGDEPIMRGGQPT